MRRFTPSPAMVISLIALFVALGGTSYAAITALPTNSVGTKQIKNGAVTAAKLSTSTAGKAKVVGSAGAPAYASGWEGVGSGDESASFYKDALGVVHLQGNAETSGPAATGRIFTLPTGYRPAGNLYFEVYGNSGVAGQIQIKADGSVNEWFVSKSYVGLSNISFRAGL
jgi:hypothetical protein